MEESLMKYVNLAEELRGNTYPGRGIVLGRSEDGKKAVIAYFIMGRSENSRNRVFVEQEGGIRTEAFDPAKLEDPSLIIYAPVRVLGKQTVTRLIPSMISSKRANLSKKHCAPEPLNRMHQTLLLVSPVW